ncbi:HAD-IA family hydrolase [Micromonospora sp. NPDC049679]|uniref:HAD-IA family hydrolase n=1 Tax=Micromonospora sp. NPDC049679 TaxID=3155920 RepID=UPI0033FC5369
MSPRWILLDYGEVISLPQSATDIAAMAAHAGRSPTDFHDRYWRHRLPYDRGQPAHSYWSAVLGRTLAVDDPLVAVLDTADVASWSRLNPHTLRMISEWEAHGVRLALLSNAPESLARAIDGAGWAAAFTQRFYSCRFGRAKPDPVLFEEVLRRLDAEPAEVTFFDDRADNVRAAADLGIDAILYRGQTPVSPRSGPVPAQEW